MSSTPKDLEELWSDILSRQPELVRTTFATLDLSRQKLVLAHLERMAKEAGWQPEQRASAKAALRTLGHLSHKEK
jgi:hypothetical protein